MPALTKRKPKSKRVVDVGARPAIAAEMAKIIDKLEGRCR